MTSWTKLGTAGDCETGAHLRRAVLLGTSCLFAAAGICGGAQASALPTRGHYVLGEGSIDKANQSLTVKQSSTTGIIDWNGFSIGAKNSVRFDNGTGATLNRVTGGNLSTIAGALHATGSLYLMNSQGVIVSGTGRVVTGGSFVATTGNLSNTAFGDDRLRNASGKIINRGTIVSGSSVTLSGGRVSDSGDISAESVNLKAIDRLKIGGAITAQNADGSGGTVVATATHIDIGGSANISASGTKGGTVLIGGDIHGGAVASDNFVTRDVAMALHSRAFPNIVAKNALLSL
jgi:filamentous hemagglutinin family protein